MLVRAGYLEQMEAVVGKGGEKGREKGEKVRGGMRTWRVVKGGTYHQMRLIG